MSRARYAREVGLRADARVGRTLGERIALGGTNWLNLRFVTPLDIALRMGAPFLVERGIDPSEEGLGPALIMRLLLDLPEKGGYFRPLADQPTMAQALWTTLRELRMAGVEVGATSRPTRSSRRRSTRSCARCSRAYETVPRRTTTAATWRSSTKRRCSIPTGARFSRRTAGPSCPARIWTPLQRRLIDAMPGERIVPRGAGASRAQRCRAA